MPAAPRARITSCVLRCPRSCSKPRRAPRSSSNRAALDSVRRGAWGAAGLGRYVPVRKWLVSHGLWSMMSPGAVSGATRALRCLWHE
eukprot:734194-Prymnesium_polylepis.1